MESTPSLSDVTYGDLSDCEGRPGTLSNPEALDFEGLDFPEQWELCRQAVEADKRAAKGDLYFIRCGDAVKVGRTIDLVERLRTMQANSPHEMDCILLLRGQGWNEKAWHKRFAEHRIRGEWFHWGPLEAAILEERRLNVERLAAK